MLTAVSFSIKVLTHYNNFYNDFSEKIFVRVVVFIILIDKTHDNTVENIVAVGKKIVVCVVDNYFIAVSVVVCEVEVFQVLFWFMFYILPSYLHIFLLGHSIQSKSQQ